MFVSFYYEKQRFNCYILTKYDIIVLVKIILSNPFNYNRVVRLERLFEESTKDFSLGKIDNRQCVLINKID